MLLGRALLFLTISFGTAIPGPGLGIRVLGDVTEDKIEIVRESEDAILREEIANAGLDREI